MAPKPINEARKDDILVLRTKLHHECPRCGRWYVPVRSDQVFCDGSCRQAAWRARRKERECHVEHEGE